MIAVVTAIKFVIIAVNHSDSGKISSGYSIKAILQKTCLDKIESKILLQRVLGFSAVQLIIQGDYSLSTIEYDNYMKLVDRRLTGMPMAYILGYKEFYSRRFIVNQATLIPRPETEMLVEMVLKLARPSARVLELGTGSGCIAISLKLENADLLVTATDKHKDTLAVARQNSLDLGADVDFIQSDWFESINKRYDIIVSNPPYIEQNDPHLVDLAFEPQYALTDFADGLSAIKQIISQAGKYLTGYLLLEHGYDQKDAVVKLMKEYGFHSIQTLKDYAGLNRITLGNNLPS